MVNILIVEDEIAIGELVKTHLTIAGYKCVYASDGITAADLIEENAFDLVILDIMLPGIDGYDLMDYIRPYDIPVIFLTARHSVNDRVKGLRLGADDYIVKPFEIVELLARVEAVLRRYHKSENKVVILDTEIDLDARTVRKYGRQIDLTAKEFGLLDMFVKNKNIALFRDMLYERVWEREYNGDSRTVELHVQRLRRKLGWEGCLKTVHGVGYRLEVE